MIYRGSLGEISNKADWVSPVYTVVNESDGTEVDLSSASIGINFAAGPALGSANPGYGTYTAANTLPASTGITISNASAGGGGAHNNTQPTMLATIYIKL